MNEKNFAKKIEDRGVESATKESVESKEIKQEKELSKGEIGELVENMKSYKRGLLNRIEEIKNEIMSAKEKESIDELNSELENLQEALEGLPEFIDDIEQENYEVIMEK